MPKIKKHSYVLMSGTSSANLADAAASVMAKLNAAGKKGAQAIAITGTFASTLVEGTTKTERWDFVVLVEE